MDYLKMIRDENRKTTKCTQVLGALMKTIDSKFEKTNNIGMSRLLDIGNLGARIIGNKITIDINLFSYGFDYANARYALKTGFHVSYIKTIIIPNKPVLSNIRCIGYHMNAGPYDSMTVANHIFYENRNTNDVIEELVRDRSLCVGPHYGRQTTASEIISMVNTLYTPYAHTMSFDIDEFGVMDMLEKQQTWTDDTVDYTWDDDDIENEEDDE